MIMPPALTPDSLWHPVQRPHHAASSSTVRIDYRQRGPDPWSFPARWLAGDFDAEDWQLPGPIESGRVGDWHYQRGAGIAFAALQLDGAGDDDPAAPVAESGQRAYEQLFALQAALALPYAGRIWHWLSSPTTGDAEQERYRAFCRGRAQALDAAPSAWAQLPPATLVASGDPGLRMHAILLDRPITPVENPRQISAYRYPPQYGQRAPAFARGGVVQLAGRSYLLISGTASIVGHESRHRGDLLAQLDEALRNIAAVIDAACPDARPQNLQCLKVYLRDPENTAPVQKALAQRLPGLPTVIAHAPLCRPELLLELEAQMALAND